MSLKYVRSYTYLFYPKQNCRFLQRGREAGDRAEDESIARLTEALREAKPLKVAITNWRKDGTAFRNLLAIKPIMDQNGDYVSTLLPHRKVCETVFRASLQDSSR